MDSDRIKPILYWIDTVVAGLGDLSDTVVFVGGAITNLLVTDPAIVRVRPTKDLDVITNTTRSGYYQLEDKLRARGFHQRLTGNDPICRWHYNEVVIDVMPTNQNILKFSNKWYLEAFESSNWHDLESGKRIRLITTPLFICTKLDALHDRGKDNYAESHDLEDIITVIDGRPELLNEWREASTNAQNYLKESFTILLQSQEFISSIEWNLPYGDNGQERVQIIESRMRRIAEG